MEVCAYVGWEGNAGQVYHYMPLTLQSLRVRSLGHGLAQA